MHLVPEDRAHRRAIDEHTVCAAIAGIGEPAAVRGWAARFALLAEPGRLALLLAIHRAGPIAVSDLALATGISETAVSQTLRLLRASGTVAADKDGRIVRYHLLDPDVAPLLDLIPRLPHDELSHDELSHDELSHGGLSHGELPHSGLSQGELPHKGAPTSQG
ncbi:metalloregulator ArsR/SmtB family transcription factor [Kitasatospora sp. NBC_01287]|uniref:ArsR/SmtB family transcription factor n=1 Tax=Kitasatospora sp. NBC_01287 TaxID=2903573 RepID=UPI002B1DCEDC|nr:metalloregulator ArsR/SmtB family transcription factor [Kitasatospora sp. NBC_01287]